MRDSASSRRGGVRALSAGLCLAAAAATGAGACASEGPAASAPVWVFFRDRGAVAVALPEPETWPAPRALARRARAARERAARGDPRALNSEADRLVPAAYVSAVEAAGAVVRTRSRWLNAVSAEADSEALAALRSLPCVADIRPVGAQARAATDAAADAAAAAEFNFGGAARQLDILHIPEAHAMGYQGEGVLIAVLDTGFDLEHEALRRLEVRAARDFVNGDDDPSYDPRTDLPGQANHGTQVLSILAGYAPGRLVGPAPAADYLLARTEQTAYEWPVEEDFWVAGLEWAEGMGADIVSSSLSYTKFYSWRDMDGRHGVATRAANLAFERGLIVVESMGNQGPREGKIGSPADAFGAISVGAVDADGRIAAFSTPGPTWDLRVKPDVAAMGVEVTHAVARTRDRYGRGNGTSYAAPLVAGCVALIVEAHPDWGPEMVREALVMSASRAAAPDHRYGWGVVNVRDAILYPQIEGRVTDFHTRETIAGARVTWEPAGGVDSLGAAPSDWPARGLARTDSTGAYVIPNLPRGIYRLHVTADGYFETVSDVIEVPPGIGDVNFELRYRGE